MKTRNLSLATVAAVGLACGAALTPFVLSAPVAAQTNPSPPNPTMTNVVPDGGEFAVQGKIAELDPGQGTFTLSPREEGQPMPFTTAPGVDLSPLSNGMVADVHFTRSVSFVLGPPHLQPGHAPVTSTVDEVAHTPGGIGYNAAVVVARVVKVNPPDSVDVVNVNGGGVYTVTSTNPSRLTMIKMLKPGDSVTVSVSPLIATSVAKCGLFGRGVFGC
jgi:hypothetical protein